MEAMGSSPRKGTLMYLVFGILRTSNRKFASRALLDHRVGTLYTMPQLSLRLASERWARVVVTRRPHNTYVRTWIVRR